jgi:hemolysin III
LLQVLPAGGFFWLTLGGVVYSIGAVIFAIDKPVIRRGVFEAHELWHVFVLAGSACHVWTIARYLAPLG